jgi:hypothetical protein
MITADIDFVDLGSEFETSAFEHVRPSHDDIDRELLARDGFDILGCNLGSTVFGDSHIRLRPVFFIVVVFFEGLPIHLDVDLDSWNLVEDRHCE